MEEQGFRKAARLMREMADIYDRLADANERDDVTQEEMAQLIGELVLKLSEIEEVQNDM